MAGRGSAVWPASSGWGYLTVLRALAALGVKVVEVQGLALTGCWVRSVRVGLIREGVSEDERWQVLDYFTQQAHQEMPVPRLSPE